MTQLNQLPNDVPVKLIRIFTGTTGNVYQPGVYEPGTLPEKAYNTYYCVPLAVAQDPNSKPVQTMVEEKRTQAKFEYEKPVEKVDLPKSVATNEINTGDFIPDELVINKATDSNEMPMKAKLSKPVEAPSLDINSAAKEDLIALNGVAKATADKIITLRKAHPFTSYEDINERVPLPFGKDWTAFQIDFTSKDEG
jgi:hypothetical protein